MTSKLNPIESGQRPVAKQGNFVVPFMIKGTNGTDLSDMLTHLTRIQRQLGCGFDEAITHAIRRDAANGGDAALDDEAAEKVASTVEAWTRMADAEHNFRCKRKEWEMRKNKESEKDIADMMAQMGSEGYRAPGEKVAEEMAAASERIDEIEGIERAIIRHFQYLHISRQVVSTVADIRNQCDAEGYLDEVGKSESAVDAWFRRSVNRMCKSAGYGKYKLHPKYSRMVEREYAESQIEKSELSETTI